jgi:glycerol-3-phosphate dehydrogenase subunit B
VDVLGYAPERVTDPLAAVAAKAAADPRHPYAVIGAAAVADGIRFLAEVAGPDLLTGSADANLQLPTAVGAVRPTCLAQPGMLAGQCVAGARFVIVGLRRLKDFHPRLVAENLARTVLPDGGRLAARHAWVDVPARAEEIDSTGLTYARAFDDPAFRERFAAALAPLVGEGETVGLPAVLGLKHPGAWRDLEQRLGHPVFEIPLQPPSIPGMRLSEALTAAAKAAGVRFVPGSRIVGTRLQEGRVQGVTAATAGAPREFTADAFVLATGGFESGALELDSYGVARETTFGLPLVLPEEPLIRGDFWDPEQPLFAVGVGVDGSLRPVDGDGRVVAANLYAVGGLLAGAYRWVEKSGEGIAVGSAVKAADEIVKELS